MLFDMEQGLFRKGFRERDIYQHFKSYTSRENFYENVHPELIKLLDVRGGPFESFENRAGETTWRLNSNLYY